MAGIIVAHPGTCIKLTHGFQKFRTKITKMLHDISDWRLVTDDWRLETGDWRLATGDWRLATG
jgi:hypothetical protein